MTQTPPREHGAFPPSGIPPCVSNPPASHPSLVVCNPYSALFGPPNCTWYVWQQLHDTESIDFQHAPSAGQWLESAQLPNSFWSETTNQFVTPQFIIPDVTQADTLPQPGDVLVLPNASAYAHPYHVAIVETAPDATGLITVGEQWASDTPTTVSFNTRPYPWTRHTTEKFWDVIDSEHGAARLVRFSGFVRQNTVDDAITIDVSPDVSVAPKQVFPIYFRMLNHGDTTWSDGGGYGLYCTANCMGVNSVGIGGDSIAPGESYTFIADLTAPTIPGSYPTTWTLEDKGVPFGDPALFVPVTVLRASSTTPTSIPSPTPTLNRLSVYSVLRDGSAQADIAKDGSQRWNYLVTGTYETGIVAVSHGILYTFVVSQTQPPALYAFDTSTGQPVWHADNVANFEGLVGGVIYLTYFTDLSTNGVTALDANTGASLWQYSVGGDTVTGFAIDGSGAFIAHDSGSPSSAVLDAVNATTGKRRWTRPTTYPLIQDVSVHSSASLLAANGDIYIATCEGSSGSCNAIHVLAFDEQTNKLVWSFDPQATGNVTLQLYGEHLFIASSSSDGTAISYVALDGQTGAQLWASSPNCKSASLLAASDVAYTTCGDDVTTSMTARNPDTGAPIWTHTGIPITGAPAIQTPSWIPEASSDGVLYVTLVGLYDVAPTIALDAQSGAILWENNSTLSDARFGIAVLADCVSENCSLTVVDAHSGAKLAQLQEDVYSGTGYALALIGP